MANREIKTTLRLEGEQQFRQAMNDAASAIKVLNSEQKLAQAQFQATGDKEQFLTDKADILRRKIEEQEKAVKAAQEAVQKLKEQGVEPNSKAMQDWTTKLNNAKTYLTRLQGDLSNTERELTDQGDAFDDAAESAGDYNAELQNIGKGVNFQNVTMILDNMNARLNSALGIVTKVLTGIIEAETAAGEWADDINTKASQTGVDAETYQSWLYASQFIDTEVDDIINARKRLLKNMTSDDEETVKLFNQLGVVVRQNNGDLRDYTEVFWDVIDALGNVEDPTLRDYYAQELLGKSANELNPLIEAGSEAYKEYAEEGREVAVVSQENIDKLQGLNDAQAKLNSEWNKAKTDVLASMAPAFENATTKASNLVDAFNKFLETERGREALEKLNTAVDDLLSTFMDEVDIEGLINGAASAIETLNSVLEWLANNGWTIVNILVAMKIAAMGFSVSKAVLEMLQLIKSIQWLNVAKGAKALGKAAETGGGATGPAAAGAGGSSAGQWLKNMFDKGKTAAGSLWSTMLPHLVNAAGPAAGLMAATVAMQAIEKNALESDYGEADRAAAEKEVIDAIETEGNARLERLKALYDEFERVYTQNPEPDEQGNISPDEYLLFKQREAELGALLGERDYGLREPFKNPNYEYSGFDVADWEIVAGNVLAALKDEIEREVSGAAAESNPFDDIIAQYTAEINAAYADLINGDIGNAADAAKEAGDETAQGFADGIDASTAAADAAARMAESVEAAVDDALEIKSPSKVMYARGEYTAQGLADGINARAEAAVMAAASLAARVQQALAGAAAVDLSGYAMSGALYSSPVYAAGGSIRGGGSGMVNMTLVMDKKVLGSGVAPIVDETLGTEIVWR